uniref:3-hydroxyisobutyryl-CoA hydrolase n=1 Tax=Rhizophora mucronata TaxID=61149 RepID=A0A2P2M4H5_RHIMU
MASQSSAKAQHHQRHDDQLLVEENMATKTLILNRPKQLNALTYPMICKLLELFLAYEEDPNVNLIILKGKGRTFCSGGDVAALVHDLCQGNGRLGFNFFRKEFTLNYLIATYSKPQVSILNGIVMGGGVGVSIHGRFFVATENSVFAMPETALGLFPDVGATYFLSRLPGFFDYFPAFFGRGISWTYRFKAGRCGNACMWPCNSLCPIGEIVSFRRGIMQCGFQ